MESQEAHTLLLQGAEHAQARRLQEAENAFAAAVLADPRLHIARFQLGLLQWSAGRTGAALVTWQPLTDMPAGVDLGHFTRAFALWLALKLPEAAAEFREGIACTGNAPLAQDMQKLLDAVSGQLATGQQADPQAQHVLLANYVSAGRSH
jgi:hypothetical protein